MSGSDDERVRQVLRGGWSIYEAEVLARTGLSNLRFFQAVDRLMTTGELTVDDHLYYRIRRHDHSSVPD